MKPLNCFFCCTRRARQVFVGRAVCSSTNYPTAVIIQPSRRRNADNARLLFRHSEPGQAKRATVRNLAPPFDKTIAVPTTIAQDPSSLTLLRVTEGRGVGVSNTARRLITTFPKIGAICVDLRCLRSNCSSLNSYPQRPISCLGTLAGPPDAHPSCRTPSLRHSE